MSTSTSNYTDAVAAVREAIEYAKPTTETDALEAANEALDNFIDSSLIYTANVLELWDGSTHSDVEGQRVDRDLSILDIIRQSTYFQLREEWADAVFDGIDEYIEAHNLDDGLDRDDALEITNGEPTDSGPFTYPGADGIEPVIDGAVTCGTCGTSWAEDITPAGRCPWEYDHVN